MLVPTFEKFISNGKEVLSIYSYDENIKSLLYKFKGCYDYELKDVFLERYARYLRLIYRGYTLIPAPSSPEDDQAREFNHVIELFSCLNLPILQIIHKNTHYKQSDQSFENRKQISNVLYIDENTDLYGKKLLVVDDVYTSGSTVNTMINLLEKCKPKTIKVLVLSKTQFINKS